jgi:hypothetical protein
MFGFETLFYSRFNHQIWDMSEKVVGRRGRGEEMGRLPTIQSRNKLFFVLMGFIWKEKSHYIVFNPNPSSWQKKKVDPVFIMFFELGWFCIFRKIKGWFKVINDFI